jgi:ammonia channel protein AmtB
MFDGDADADPSTPEAELFGPGVTFGKSITAQLAGIGTIILWSGFLSFIMFSIIKAAGLLRVLEEEEAMGIDQSEFSPTNAYNTTNKVSPTKTVSLTVVPANTSD